MGQPMQSAMNARLNKVTESPALTGMMSYIVGSLSLLVLWLSNAIGRGKVAGLVEAPWWVWGAGLAGAFSVTTNMVALPRVSAAVVIAAGLVGQSIASLIIDHYGWLGVPRVPLNAWRVGGVVLVFVGMLLMQRK